MHCPLHFTACGENHFRQVDYFLYQRYGDLFVLTYPEPTSFATHSKSMNAFSASAVIPYHSVHLNGLNFTDYVPKC